MAHFAEGHEPEQEYHPTNRHITSTKDAMDGDADRRWFLQGGHGAYPNMGIPPVTWQWKIPSSMEVLRGKIKSQYGG